MLVGYACSYSLHSNGFLVFSGRTSPLLRFVASGRADIALGRNGGGSATRAADSISEIDFPKSPRLSLRSNHDEPIERGQRSNGYTNENLRIMRCNKVYKIRSIHIAQFAAVAAIGGARSLRLHHVRTQCSLRRWVVNAIGEWIDSGTVRRVAMPKAWRSAPRMKRPPLLLQHQ